MTVKILGILLTMIGGLGLLYACGNLIAVPFMQDQLREALPVTETAVEQATEISRGKTIVGIVCFAAMTTLSVLLVRRRSSNT